MKEAQTQLKVVTTKKEKSSEIFKGKTYTKSDAQTETTPKNRISPTKQRSHRSSKNCLRQNKNISPKKPEPLK